MPKKLNNDSQCVDGELRLAGLDSRIIGLLAAIDQSGSINQAAKIMGLSYKGAWQMIERANLSVPRALVMTATGGNRGGGTSLSPAGKIVVALFKQLELRHHAFIQQLNADLIETPEILFLLQHSLIQSSATNQLSGTIDRIIVGAVHAEVVVRLQDGAKILANISLSSMSELGLKFGARAILLIHSADIVLVTEMDPKQFSVRNYLSGKIIRMQQDEIEAQISVILPSGELLSVSITQQSALNLSLTLGLTVGLVFKINAPILGVISNA